MLRVGPTSGPAADSRGLLAALVDDGRPLLSLTGLALAFAGCFALFSSARGEFLPHDIAFLGATADELRALGGGRVALFMFHDRVAFGGALIAIGTLYLWLAAFPLRRGERWAWWAFVGSGVTGFGSFLTYLGYGYLDSWHGAATVALLPLFVVGLLRSRRLIVGSPPLERPRLPRGPGRLGRRLLLATGAGMLAAGATIAIVGMSTVFVPQDLDYMGMTAGELAAVNPRLVPLIAHDRAGFGGGIASCGLLVLFCVAYGRASRSLWEALAVSGVAGFGTAIGVHFTIGYTDFGHLAPAYAGLSLFLVGLLLARRQPRLP